MTIVSDATFYWFAILLLGGSSIGWGASEVWRLRRYRRDGRKDPDEAFGLAIGLAISLFGLFIILVHFAGW